MDEWVLVDTCVWAEFFNHPHSPEKAKVDELLDADRVVLVGPILAEILIGFRRKDQSDWAVSRLRMAHYIEAEWRDWRAAAEIGRTLQIKGHRLPLTDLVIAAVAQRNGVWIYTTDPHFDLIAGLKRLP